MIDAGSFGRLGRWLSEPRDAAALAFFRFAFGVIVFISALRFLSMGWVDEFYVKPAFHFSYWGFAWIPAPPAALAPWLFVALAALGVCVAVGLCYRPAIVLLFALFTYLQLVDLATYLNHYYLVSLLALLLCFIPAHRAFSLDARLRPNIAASTLPAWCTMLLRFQVAIVYVNAGLGKATGDWLLHAQPLNIWLASRTDLPLIGSYLDLPSVAYVAAWAGFVFDTTIAFFLLWRPARRFAYLAVIGFHLMTHVLFPSIGMFPIIMVVAALVFFDPSWPRSVAAQVRRITRRPIPPISSAPVTVGPAVRRRKFTAGLAVATAFAVFQILIPLRAHAYGGNVLWHEQGMRFSWRVMTRAKAGSVLFVVRDPATGREWHVPPTKYLTRLQEREMAVQPDLILQLAQHIARDFAARGRPGVEVHADARVSLNGRPAVLLVDPGADLAHQDDGLGSKPWITQAPAGAPPLLRPLHRSWNL